jgi:hypothetical protein
MSQITVQKITKTTLIHDYLLSRKKPIMGSSANFVACNICGKGIEDGFSVTAKSFPKGNFFFCDVHNC